MVVTHFCIGSCFACEGGFEYDGHSAICALNPADAVTAAEAIISCGAQAAVVCGVHSSINPQQEDEFAALLQQQLSQLATGRLCNNVLTAESASKGSCTWAADSAVLCSLVW